MTPKQGRTTAFAVVGKVFPLALAAAAICLLMPRVAIAGGWIRLLAPHDKGYTVTIALDLNGDMYVCGSVKEIGGEETGEGANKIVVTKYGADARRIWTKRFGDGHRNQCVDVALDGQGNLHAAAISVDEKGTKALVARYSATGEDLGYGEYSMGKAAMWTGIAPDREGNIYIAGFSALEGAATKEAFVAKYDKAAQQVWRRSIPKEAESRAEGHAVTVGDDGVYVTGWIGGPVGNTAGSVRKAFIAKFSTVGYFGWMKIFGGKGDVEGNAIALGPQGDLLVAGVTTGDLPGSRGFGGADAFLAKFSKSGEAGWIEMFGTPNREYGCGAAFDDEGGMYLGGASHVAVHGKESTDSFDLFLARYAPEGTRDVAGTGAMPVKRPEAGLVSAAFTGRIVLNTGNRTSIYNTSFEDFIGKANEDRWSVRRWLVGPETIIADKEKPEETATKEDEKKGAHLTSFKKEQKSFLTRDVDDVGYVHNLFGKSVIFVGSSLALVGLLLLL